jgi:ABC-type branched-subunit amino acid transport system substrate-binding protein
MLKPKALRGGFPLFTLVLAMVAFALLALACDDEDEEAATPTPPVAETPTEAATPTEEATPTEQATVAAPRPGDAGIPSNPREVRGLEGIITLDDGLAMWDERPADENRRGVTADTIKLGRPTGISGILGLYDAPWSAMLFPVIERVNEAGGIHGRMLEVLNRDTKSDPAVGAQVTRELVEDDQIFAMFFQFGDPTHVAMHDYHVAEEVPNLFHMGGSIVGYEPVTGLWDFKGIAPDTEGGQALAEAVYQQDPEAKVAIVYADFPASVIGHEAIAYRLGERGVEIVGEFAHDLMQIELTSVAQQVDEAGADWLIYHGTQIHVVSLVKALRESVGWDGNVAQWGWVQGDDDLEELFDGVIGIGVTRDSVYTAPDLPIWAKLEVLADEEGVDLTPGLASTVVANVEMLVRALELAGPDLTVEGLIEALRNGFSVEDNWVCATACFAPIIMGPQDHYPVETWHFTRWDNATKTSEVFGEIMDFETSKGLGPRGNFPGLDCQPPSAEYPKGTCPWEEGG